jgi:hypothetical protein
MLSENSPAVFLDDDLIQYLKYEAERRRMTVEEIYQEEMACQQLAEKQAFTRAELKALAEASHPDPRLLEGEEECPF